MPKIKKVTGSQIKSIPYYIIFEFNYQGTEVSVKTKNNDSLVKVVGLCGSAAVACKILTKPKFPEEQSID